MTSVRFNWVKCIMNLDLYHILDWFQYPVAAFSLFCGSLVQMSLSGSVKLWKWRASGVKSSVPLGNTWERCWDVSNLWILAFQMDMEHIKRRVAGYFHDDIGPMEISCDFCFWGVEGNRSRKTAVCSSQDDMWHSVIHLLLCIYKLFGRFRFFFFFRDLH